MDEGILCFGEIVSIALGCGVGKSQVAILMPTPSEKEY
jgi:hypothetical protein